MAQIPTLKIINFKVRIQAIKISMSGKADPDDSTRCITVKNYILPRGICP